MGDIFMLKDEADNDFKNDMSEKINLDDLYDNNKNIYEKKKILYNRILKLVHKTIQSHAKKQQTYCWYEIPDVMWGIPKYDSSECIAHIIYQLNNNDFMVRYVHPNRLFIVWKHWVPSYLRNDLKIKHGITINQYGTIIPTDENNPDEDNPTNDAISQNPHNGLFMPPGDATGMRGRNNPQQSKQYRSIQSYKPQGVYNEELLNKLGEKMNESTSF